MSRTGHLFLAARGKEVRVGTPVPQLALARQLALHTGTLLAESPPFDLDYAFAPLLYGMACGLRRLRSWWS